MQDSEIRAKLVGFVDMIEAGANEGSFKSEGKVWICIHRRNYLDVLASIRATIAQIDEPPIVIPAPEPKPKRSKKGSSDEPVTAREDTGGG